MAEPSTLEAFEFMADIALTRHVYAAEDRALEKNCDIEDELDFIPVLRPLLMSLLASGWKPIDANTPRHREILVYCPPRPDEDLPYLVSVCKWHPDAGFCVDELREPTLYQDIHLPYQES